MEKKTFIKTSIKMNGELSYICRFLCEISSKFIDNMRIYGEKSVKAIRFQMIETMV